MRNMEECSARYMTSKKRIKKTAEIDTSNNKNKWWKGQFLWIMELALFVHWVVTFNHHYYYQPKKTTRKFVFHFFFLSADELILCPTSLYSTIFAFRISLHFIRDFFSSKKINAYHNKHWNTYSFEKQSDLW